MKSATNDVYSCGIICIFNILIFSHKLQLVICSRHVSHSVEPPRSKETHELIPLLLQGKKEGHQGQAPQHEEY